MTRWVAGVVVGVVVAGAAVGCDVPPAPDAAPGPSGIRPPAPTVAASPPAPKAPACPAGGVRLAEGAGDAAMGLRVADIQLVNCGTEPYVLEGYPEVRLLDGKRAPVEVAVQHGGDGIAAAPTGTEGDPQRVELRPGQAAGFGMVWRNLVTDSTVPAAEGWVLEVTPRAGAPRLELELRHSVDLGNTGKLGISPWKAAAR
ncbi:DUF4232 domain-containing protein [Streptomyces vinaceus]|uniref:DUF4232 domain-containing protein n=1 Tax=Streptomyces vinaceus TaxID=1960 RepID=A0A5J6JIU3_STRVI|nr:DUF4232 domain-containing protein [Streptomyces vinaceus]QEV47408.1 DUF4232 domain-containing protein [Streptomyces vinaceus]